MSLGAGPVRVGIVGAGSRGRLHARHVHRAGGRVAAIAEPHAGRRDRIADAHDVPAAARYADWADLAERGADRLDVVVIATQDHDHVEPAVAFAQRGVHLLCEKPVATDEPGARRVADAVRRAGVQFTVCHPLRYAPSTRALVAALRAGRVGDVVSVQHLEPVGAWHFAHSYVRGPWRREETASSLLLAKCSHDIDLLTHLVGDRPARLSSFGRLSHFRPEHRPADAAARCLDCPVEPTCPFSAPRLYRSCLGDPDWEEQLLSAVTEAPTPAALDAALRDGPYGRCVYGGDNDVVDHQVVAFEFANGVSATHTVTAFTEPASRQTRVFGTHGSVEVDGAVLRFHDFRAHPRTTVETLTTGDGRAPHQQGDEELVRAFLHAVAHDDPDANLTGLDEALASHRIVWAAERSRRSGQTVRMTWDGEGADGAVSASPVRACG
ncbi:Gfo/Idh/MocA family protein [Actinomycetospora straminea]|uniref:Gfo/Idh/MocA family oxidoreductase n=1 Tax=Actinomycetospora straminea TaxID=663607 RepID=A0ABP9EH11_9PSEU|nr:Gfo/Idh/MocA family oxidoreductase [Actinomycetospora straminea]MDD7934531.1 Gfo/Idh/MocA family oxidoreductase [Actinomycetospora straminea]